LQRCAVRVVYSRNSSKGHWRAHGRYIARERASDSGVGFNERDESIDIAGRLGGWQKAGDERLWKLIVSPEFGDRADLKQLTRDLVSEMETDLGMPLEWVAVAHFNTEHPHVHVALRGMGGTGRPVRLSRDYIREGIRHIAEDHCTRQLGFRSELDAAEAQRQEVHQLRYTSLDRIITRDAGTGDHPGSPFFTLTKDPSRGGVGPTVSLTERRCAERLMFLSSMGLAEAAGPKTWRVRRDFEDVLRAAQRGADWQKTLAAHGVPVSDARLPINVLDLQSVTTLEGRILVHGEEECSGRAYMMMEGTDARFHYIRYTPEMDAARSRGGLRTNAFIRLRNVSVDGRSKLKISELGDAESILRNRLYLRETARKLTQQGIVPQDEGWDGWLGRYQRALRDVVPKRLLDKARDLGR
jgi:hypothetical protein